MTTAARNRAIARAVGRIARNQREPYDECDAHLQRGGDELFADGFASNNAGGTLGGISTGQDLRVSIAIKPTSSIMSPKQSIDLDGKPITVQTKGRHDPCVGIRATPIAEAMLALVLMDHALRHRAQCGDVQVKVAPIPASRTKSKGD